MTLTVAVGELTRVLPWALRALGYPFGTADRAARLVATAAALDPAVLDRIAQTGQRPGAGAHVRRTPDGLRVDAHGCSLFETGAVVMDYLAAHGHTAPTVTARVAGATDPELLSAVVLTGADYGMTAIALKPDDHAGGWVAALPDGTAAPLYAGTDKAALLEGVRHPDLAARIAQADTGADLVFLATREPAALSFETPGTCAAAAVARANAHGIPVSEDTLKALYALEMITWAPTSERSRAQAGFTPKTAGAS